MKTFTLSSFVLATSTCASIIPSKPNVKATYRWEKSNNGHLLSLHDINGGYLGAACSPILNTTTLGIAPISYNFDIERPWEGTFSTGGHDYGLFWDETNGDPKCAVAYNADFIEAQCHFFAETSSMMQAFDVQQLSECVDLSWQMGQIAKGSSVVDTTPATSANLTMSNSPPAARDIDAGTITRDTVRVNDGNPHQDGWNYQCNTPLTCEGGNTCSSGVTISDAFTWSFMASVTPFKWISAGFNVGKSYTTAETQTCNAMAGQTVCVWHVEIYTAYTVQNEVIVCSSFGCSTKKNGDPFVLNSPNTKQINAHYYCVVNTCRNKGEGYFSNGPAGPAPE